MPTPYQCPPEAHATFVQPQRMVDLTFPGARVRSVEDPAAWTELRHCRICASTFLLHGKGETQRWVYSVAPANNGASPELFLVLEEVAEHLAAQGLSADAVTRYVVGLDTEEPITIGERLWLGEAIARRAA